MTLPSSNFLPPFPPFSLFPQHSLVIKKNKVYSAKAHQEQPLAIWRHCPSYKGQGLQGAASGRPEPSPKARWGCCLFRLRGSRQRIKPKGVSSEWRSIYYPKCLLSPGFAWGLAPGEIAGTHSVVRQCGPRVLRSLNLKWFGLFPYLSPSPSLGSSSLKNIRPNSTTF